jgi:phosphomannomutase
MPEPTNTPSAPSCIIIAASAGVAMPPAVNSTTGRRPDSATSALGEQDRPLSELMARYDRYAASGEVNSTVQDAQAAMAEVEQTFGAREGVTTDDLDGLTVALPDGSWFNLRPSNTEPLLRLNVEAADDDAVAALRDEVLALVRG